MHTSKDNVSLPTTPVGFYLHIVKRHKWSMFSIVFIVLLTEVLSTFGARVIGQIVDLAQLSEQPTSEVITQIGWLLLLYVVVLRFGPVLLIRIRAMLMHIISKTLRTQAMQQLFNFLSQHSASYFASRFAGSLSSDVNTVGQNMVRLNFFAIDGLLGIFFMFIATSIMLSTADLRLTAMFVLGTIILTPINYFLSKRTMRLSADWVSSLARLRGRIIDSITNVAAVQQFARREQELAELDMYIEDYQKKSIKADIFNEQVLLVNNVLVVLVFVGAMLYISYMLWSSGDITLGEFVMVITLLSIIVRSWSHVGNTINNFARMYGEVEKGLEQILLPHEIQDSADATELSVSTGEVVFSNVVFSYEEETDVFENLNLIIPAGQKVGVVGSSGGGKTTLTKLLLRQYEVAGSISIDGQDIKHVTQDSLRSNIGLVPQDPQLFHRTIADNIRYGKPDASMAEVVEAAKKAQIHDFVDGLKDGYDTLVGERGIKLSGGQRQRIAIARAVIKNAPILILDEATSALDSESEVHIQKALTTLMKNKTVIAIAHRLSTLKGMDRIIVFDEGTIVQDGSHEDLLTEQEGVYARLWSRQAGGFVEAE